MQMSTQELNDRIDSFITKKHHQFPELALRSVKREESRMSQLLELFAGNQESQMGFGKQ